MHLPEADLGRGETFLELMEATYVTFRDRLISIHRDNTCRCRACEAVPSLDLKFLVHFGDYTITPGSDGRADLGGLDANLVRERLLKDQVEGSNGGRAYVLFTDQSLVQMDIRPEDMRSNRGEYPHMGEITTSSLDLARRYERLTEARTLYVTPEEADLAVSEKVPAPAHVVWEWLNEAEKRTRWMRWRTWSEAFRPGGRTGVGAQNHCAHGLGTIIETIRDWRPFDYFSVDVEQSSLRLYAEQTYELTPVAGNGGTQVSFRARFLEANPRWLQAMEGPVLAWLMRRDLKRLARLVAEVHI